MTGGPDDTDGLSPRVMAYSRIWRWENDTLRFIGLRWNSSLRLAWKEEEEGLVLAERTLELLRQDFSWAGSVWRRRRGEAAAEAVKGEQPKLELACWAEDAWAAAGRLRRARPAEMAGAEDAWAAAGRLRRARPAEMADRESALGKSDRRGGGLPRLLRLLALAPLGLAWTERSSSCSCSRSRSQASSEVSFGMGGPPTEEEEEEERFHALALLSSMSMSRVPVYSACMVGLCWGERYESENNGENERTLETGGYGSVVRNQKLF